MSVKFKALQMVFEVQKIRPTYIYKDLKQKLVLYVQTLHFHLLHFHKSYLVHLKTNSSDFYDIRCIKKGVKKYFQCSKAIDRCEENYKTLFPKVFTSLSITILKLQYVLL
jgi:hypothetical protein